MSFVLIVEPEEVNASRIRTILDSVDKSFEFELVDSAERAIEVLENRKTDVFVGDMQMPVMTGTELFSMVEMLSPDTIRIVMTDGGRINETVSFMNECRIFKIIIKPCRVADDLLTPIHAALSYKKAKENMSREMQDADLGRFSTEQDYERMERAWREKLANYQRVQRVFTEITACNIELSDMEPMIKERLKRWYQFMLEEYVHQVLAGTGDYEAAVRSLMGTYHDPEHGCTFLMQKNSKDSIDPERMNEMTYILRLTAGVCKDLQNSYHISALIETTEKAYILRIRYRMEKDAEGKVNERNFRVRNKELRSALIRATEIGIDAFGYKSVILNKEQENIFNIAVPRQ